MEYKDFKAKDFRDKSFFKDIGTKKNTVMNLRKKQLLEKVKQKKLLNEQ